MAAITSHHARQRSPSLPLPQWFLVILPLPFPSRTSTSTSSSETSSTLKAHYPLPLPTLFITPASPESTSEFTVRRSLQEIVFEDYGGGDLVFDTGGERGDGGEEVQSEKNFSPEFLKIPLEREGWYHSNGEKDRCRIFTASYWPLSRGRYWISRVSVVIIVLGITLGLGVGFSHPNQLASYQAGSVGPLSNTSSKKGKTTVAAGVVGIRSETVTKSSGSRMVISTMRNSSRKKGSVNSSGWPRVATSEVDLDTTASASPIAQQTKLVPLLTSSPTPPSSSNPTQASTNSASVVNLAQTTAETIAPKNYGSPTTSSPASTTPSSSSAIE